MNDILKTFLSMSLSGSLLILVLLLIRPLARGRCSRRWQFYIWLVVVARLLLPFTPEKSPVGALFQRADRAAVQEASAPPTDGDVPAPPPAEEDTARGNSLPAREGGGASPAAAGLSWSVVRDCLWLLWPAVALALLVRKITAYQSFARYVRAGRREVTDPALLDRLAEMGERAGVGRPVELYENSLISSPLLLGFFRPCIVFPDANLPEEDFRYTVLHELTHYRRGDMFYKWLVQVTACLHWFNPLVWLMCGEVNRDCELSCDEAVIRGLDEEGRRAYGDTLVRAMGVGGDYRSSLASVPLSAGAKLLKERLQGIMGFKRQTRAAAALSMLLAAVLLTGAAMAGAYPGPAAKGTPAAGFRYTQEGYYEDGYLFEIGWNLGEEAAGAYAGTEVALPGGGSMTVLLQADCVKALRDGDAFQALTAVIGRLWREARDTAFPLLRPLVVGVEPTGDGTPAQLARQYYKDGSLPQFGAAFALLEEEDQEAFLETAYGDGRVAFFAAALGKLEEDSPLPERLAGEIYEDGNIAFFSVLTGYMDDDTLEEWLDRAVRDKRTNFQAMLYSVSGKDRELEDMKAKLELEQAEAYKAHGITKDGFDYYYKNQLVRLFMDTRPDGSFVTLNMNPEGTVDVKVTRDSGGKIKSVGPMTESEAMEMLEDLEDLDDLDDDLDDLDDWDWTEDRNWDWEEDLETDRDRADWKDAAGAVPIERKNVKAGEVLWLGEYELAEGDRVCYDVSAETNAGMQVGFAKPGDEALDTTYLSVTNWSGDGEARCAASFTVREPVQPGRYRMFLRSKGGALANVAGSYAVLSAGDEGPEPEAPARLSLEELPGEVAEVMNACSIRRWYLIEAGGRQYVWYNGLARNYAWRPEARGDAWQVDIEPLSKKDAGYVLLSFPGGGDLTVRYDGQKVNLTALKAGEERK